MSSGRIIVLGAGGWGTALAVLWQQNGAAVTLWGNNPARVCEMCESRENRTYLPGISLQPAMQVTSQLSACQDGDLIVFAVPSTALRGIAEQVSKVLGRRSPVILSCTKGIEHESGKRMSEILEELLPNRVYAVLSGPNLAVEVSRGLPTAAVLGCRDNHSREKLQHYLSSSTFRIYTSAEIASIELGGALKNVFAVAAGVSDGLGFGDNAKAALVTRALAEMLRLGVAMGGNGNTFYGLSGAGDLIATCFSRHSRNRAVGEQLGRGQKIEEILAATKTVAEGVPTAKSAYECARKLRVETPIIDQVFSILHESKKPSEAFAQLLQREQKAERA